MSLLLITLYFTGQLIFSPVFHYAELHLGLAGTLFILAAVVSSGIIFGFFFKPLEDDGNDNNNYIGNVNLAFEKDISDETMGPKDVAEVEENLEESFSKSYLQILRSLPMMILMTSHLFMHLG